MGVRSALLRYAARRPTVLPVALPGGTASRLAVEAELCRRGLPAADTPADADLLVVCGVPTHRDLPWLDRLGAAVPSPASRVVVPAADRAADLLDTATTLLGTAPLAYRPAPSDDGEPETARRGDDRDGLRLDRLRLTLGPALPDWPAGLVLRLTLQGDLVQTAETDTRCAVGRVVLPAGRAPFWDEPALNAASGAPFVTRGQVARRCCAAHLDSTARLLAVTGCDALAARCRRSRDTVLAGAPSARIVGELRATTRRVARSRTVRRALAGVGPLPRRRARAAGVTGPALVADGDSHDRLLVWMAEVERFGADLDDPRAPETGGGPSGPRGVLDPARPPSAALLGVLPGLLAGVDFAAARIIVASLDPDLDELTSSPDRPETPHG
ncbi:hypothetical protein AAH978_13635 [Streptomyces sp. ZYX-F-203]